MSLLLVVGAYLVGAVPFGLLVVRAATGRDVRAQGSGNIGATNVFRTAGPALGAVVMVLDLLKGLAPVLAAQRLGASPALAVGAGLAAVIGHNWSVFLRGKGGKGVATSYGALLGVSPAVGLVAAALWIGVVAGTRLASLASLIGVASVPVVIAIRREPMAHIVFGVALVILAVYQHRANIRRLMHGEELPIMPRRTRSPKR
jgi:glycerol-3-phosphate acyltransferase PlsY